MRARQPLSRRARVAAAALAGGLLPLALVAGTTSVASTAAEGTRSGLGTGGDFSGMWLSGTDSASTPATTLAQVRTIIGADTGAAASLTGKGVGVALIDTGVAAVP